MIIAAFAELNPFNLRNSLPEGHENYMAAKNLVFNDRLPRRFCLPARGLPCLCPERRPDALRCGPRGLSLSARRLAVAGLNKIPKRFIAENALACADLEHAPAWGAALRRWT